MNTTINTKIDTSMTNEENMDMYFELAIKALIQNHFKSCMMYFKQSISHGNKRAYTYRNFLCCYKDIILARDIILCAEKRI
ncbi:MAG: hypothetical protein PVI75_03255 [Gammaproteobacteria bacterium]